MPLTIEEKTLLRENFQAAGERIDGLEEETKLSVKELKATVDELQRKLRTVYRSMATGVTETGQVYRRFWETDNQAKEFGELFLKAAGRKALGEGTATAGGVLVPEELMLRVIAKLGQYGKFRRDATVLPMGSDTTKVPKIDVDLTVYEPGENADLEHSDMSFSQVGLTAKKWACITKVSSELEEDSIIALGEILALSMVRSMAKKEDEVGFIGDGTETYFGMTGIVGALRGVDATIGNIAGLQVGSGNAYSELTIDDFEDLVALLPSEADEGAAWYVSKKFFFSVMHRLARAAGASDMFAILSDRKERYFMGYLVNFVHAMPSVEANSQICALLGDLQLGAYLGERRELRIDRSAEVHFTNDQIGFRGIERIDINAFGVGDTSEAGPIVGLITAAA
jgi:HK97 family phage major capsid protein